VTRSRETGELETADLLVLAPSHGANPQELRDIIEGREFVGPTLVILPKWNALPWNLLSQVEEPEEAGDGWVFLMGASVPAWANQKVGPLALNVSTDGEAGPQATDKVLDSENTAQAQNQPKLQFATAGAITGLRGDLPSGSGVFAEPAQAHTPLVVNQDGRALALALGAQSASGETIAEVDEYGDSVNPNWVVFVIEPDLMNNWGLADPDRAQTALSIIRLMADDYSGRVVFDLTLNGFGGAMNLLTLAFQPPFLAATMCLILALFVLGWRAFLRFGPPATSERETAFGKASLVTNGADLIARAGRLNLLAEPYIRLTQERSGGGNPDSDPSSTARADDIRRATKPAEILRAARALYRQSQDT